MTDAARARMVEKHIAARGISDPAILEAFRTVPREEFVPEHLRDHAFDDGPLPIEAEQTISQPYIVALMAEAAAVRPGERVLEIGAGSGYAAAILGRLAGAVIAIERQPELAALARERVTRLGYRNIRIVEGDGTRGCPDEAPFDAILAAASGPHVPLALCQQLAVGGRLVIPVGELNGVQQLIKVTRRGPKEFEEQDLGPVRFVPLIGTDGWTER